MTPLQAVMTAVPAAAFLWFLTFLGPVAAGETIRVEWAWAPSMGITLSFLIDGLSLMFALLITGIGAFIMLYAGSYLAGHPQIGRFYLFLGAFTASMLGLVLADNLIALFVFWELTTITSYLLIGFDHETGKARWSALQGLLVTGAGGLAMLAGFLLIGWQAGTFEISELDGAALRAHALYPAILVLVLAGAFTKSAQFPFHFWLPNAMAAPTPVSAFLHSATMVKAGVYLMARMQPSLGGTEMWTTALVTAGAVTAVLASILAIRQTDFKTMLAYTTLMALGTLTMFLGVDAGYATAAAMVFILTHALYKAALFLVVGILDHETGTRDLRNLSGLRAALPITAVAAGLAALSMAGIPPLIGFVGKEYLYKGALAAGDVAFWVLLAALSANAMMVSVALMLGVGPWIGARKETPTPPHEGHWTLWCGPLTMGVVGLLCGVGIAVTSLLLMPAASASLGEPWTTPFKLWEGINAPLLLSVLTLAAGGALWWKRDAIRAALVWADARVPAADDIYDWKIDSMKAFAAWQTRTLQSGSMRAYMRIVFGVFAVTGLFTLFARDAVVLPDTMPYLTFYEWGMVALVAIGTLVTVFTESRLGAIAALGVVGTAIAALFLLFGAPDVAITQLMVEILVVVILALVLLRLPRFRGAAHAGPAGTALDAVIAVACGLAVTLVMLAVTMGPIDRTLTAYFEATSVPEGIGRNIVNVILVDFRAIDTLGEIVVVAVAGLACVSLIRLRARRRTDEGGGGP